MKLALPNIILAPLAGCADLSFRLIAREHGARFCYFEMLDSNALMYNLDNSSNADAINTISKDQPIAAQILGSEPEMTLKAAQKLLGLVKVSYLELNAACPVKKVIKKKAGAHLLRDPKMLYKIIKKLSTNLELPITVKLRSGFHEENHKEIVDIAKNCQKNGASAIFIHGRTQDQGYKGAVDYKAIKAVKESVDIPVIGSGNILSPQLAKRMFDETGCDGILVARGSFGNPWIFKDIENYLTKGIEPKPIDLETRKKVLIKHLHFIEKYKNTKSKHLVGFLRKVAIWYTTSFKKSAEVRNKITFAKTREEIFDIIDSI